MKDWLSYHRHDILFFIWLPLIVPTVTIWKNSVSWLNFMSIFAILYAIVAAREGMRPSRPKPKKRQNK